MRSHDAVTVSTTLALDPATAFRVFTEEVDEWWRRSSRYRLRPSGGVLRFEPGVGGRLVETDGEGRDLFEVGRVLAWEPGKRLVFEWRSRDFQPAERTEVEVRFEGVGERTRVVLTHRGWDGIPGEHAARHGLTGDAFTSMIGLWWADLLVGLRRRPARASGPPPSP